MLQFSDAQLADARARWDVIAADVPLRRRGRELVGVCPFHNEKTPSFTIVSAKGFFHCFGCGAHGTAIDYVMRRRGMDFADAVREILRLPPQQPRAAGPGPAAPAEPDEHTIERVREVLAGCAPVHDSTPAGVYLALRGLDPRSPGLLAHPDLPYSEETNGPGDEPPPWRRWYSRKLKSWYRGTSFPALVAPIVQLDGAVTAVQRIWVQRQAYFDGRPLSTRSIRAELQTRKKTLGHMGAGAVHLREAVKPILGLAEGVETGLAVQALFTQLPIWVACGVHRFGYPAHWRQVGVPPGVRPNIWIGGPKPRGVEAVFVPERPPTIAIPPHVEQVIVFGDAGSTGEVIAEHAADWWRRQGREAAAVFPSPGFDDFNSELLGERSR